MVYAGAITIGVKRSAGSEIVPESSPTLTPCTSSTMVPYDAKSSVKDGTGLKSDSKPPPPPSQAKRQKEADTIVSSSETDETRSLSNTQLQRLVMLKQLELLKMKISRFTGTANNYLDGVVD